ncbi:MAG: 30S ribosomal protein S9 [Patescibacteria group bacterium]|nr:30S ribosomal protein S9 [Patescibacteria group bacterium]
MPKKIEEKKSKIVKKKPIKKAVKKPVKKAVKSTKKTVVKSKKSVKAKTSQTKRYIEAVGRRKTAVARVRIWTKSGEEFLINEKKYQDYFPPIESQKIVLSPIEIINSKEKFKVSAKVKGGGSHSQAEAVRHGLARTLIKFDPELRTQLKKAGFLTRDPRMRERKKFGLKRARKASQWSKR